MALGTVRIDTQGKTLVKYWRFWIGDTEITTLVRNVTVRAGMKNMVAVVEFELIAREIEFPAEIQAHITVEPVYLDKFADIGKVTG
jgi:hypothetical protein